MLDANRPSVSLGTFVMQTSLLTLPYFYYSMSLHMILSRSCLYDDIYLHDLPILYLAAMPFACNAISCLLSLLTLTDLVTYAPSSMPSSSLPCLYLRCNCHLPCPMSHHALLCIIGLPFMLPSTLYLLHHRFIDPSHLLPL